MKAVNWEKVQSLENVFQHFYFSSPPWPAGMDLDPARTRTAYKWVSLDSWAASLSFGLISVKSRVGLTIVSIFWKDTVGQVGKGAVSDVTSLQVPGVVTHR